MDKWEIRVLRDPPARVDERAYRDDAATRAGKVYPVTTGVMAYPDYQADVVYQVILDNKDTLAATGCRVWTDNQAYLVPRDGKATGAPLSKVNQVPRECRAS